MQQDTVETAWWGPKYGPEHAQPGGSCRETNLETPSKTVMRFKRVLVYSKLGCRHCKAAKALLADKGVPYYGKLVAVCDCLGAAVIPCGMWQKSTVTHFRIGEKL
jgi:hypothetical protein